MGWGRPNFATSSGETWVGRLRPISSRNCCVLPLMAMGTVIRSLPDACWSGAVSAISGRVQLRAASACARGVCGVGAAVCAAAALFNPSNAMNVTDVCLNMASSRCGLPAIHLSASRMTRRFDLMRLPAPVYLLHGSRAIKKLTDVGGRKMVPQVRIELTTYPLPRDCATTTLLRQPWYRGLTRLIRSAPLPPKVRCYNVRIRQR